MPQNLMSMATSFAFGSRRSNVKGAMGEVLRNLGALPGLKAQYQVHRNVRPDGATNNCPEAFIANLHETCAGEYIRCSVEADGSAYTVTLPSRGHSARYPVKARGDRASAVN